MTAIRARYGPSSALRHPERGRLSACRLRRHHAAEWSRHSPTGLHQVAARLLRPTARVCPGPPYQIWRIRRCCILPVREWPLPRVADRSHVIEGPDHHRVAHANVPQDLPLECNARNLSRCRISHNRRAGAIPQSLNRKDREERPCQGKDTEGVDHSRNSLGHFHSPLI